MLKLTGVFAVTALAMWLIFNASEWYAGNAALPRYCDDPAAAIGMVSEILISPEPVASNRRDFIVAAKLIFLVPQADGESLHDYKHRLRSRISESCQ